MKKIFVFALLVGVSLVVSPLVAALSSTFVVLPTTLGVFDSNHVIGVMMDGAPAFGTGSFKSDGVAKTDMYFYPENPTMFGHSVKISDIESISYWTKKGTTHAVNLVDWAGLIYTKPYAGDVSSATWYGDRIGFEPYFAMNMNDPAGQWNQWSTDPGDNQLKIYESTAGAPGATFGSYTDPDFATFKTSNSLSGQPYANHEVFAFSIQTGSGTASGFMGQVDGLRVELANGEVASVNMEAVNQPADRDSCKKNGYMTLFRGNGTPFATQGDCVSYAMTAK